MEKIISVKPVPEYFNFTWMLGSRCNYDCMYCPPELHDNTSVPHDLASMQLAWNNVHKKTQHNNLLYKISFTGGEVTANKNFLPLVKWLKETYQDIGMIITTTNGSASQRYYEQLSEYVDAISFSTHSEFMNEKRFFNTVLSLNQLMTRPKKSVHVNVMNEYWNQDRIAIYQDWLTKHNISHSINNIQYEKQTRTHILKQGIQNLEL